MSDPEIQKKQRPVKTGRSLGDALPKPVSEIVPHPRGASNVPPRDRVMVYIDGFNLYFGLKTAKWERYYWLNVQALAEHLVRKHQVLAVTKYFTARINRPPEKQARQSLYLDALKTVSTLEIIEGKYRSDEKLCVKCQHPRQIDQEKQTDVNIAVAMLTDAALNRYDVAFLISGDSDLVPAVNAVQAMYPNKEVWMAFPPNRAHDELKRAAAGRVRIKEYMLAASQFPDSVLGEDGYRLQRPEYWKAKDSDYPPSTTD